MRPVARTIVFLVVALSVVTLFFLFKYSKTIKLFSSSSENRRASPAFKVSIQGTTNVSNAEFENIVVNPLFLQKKTFSEDELQLEFQFQVDDVLRTVKVSAKAPFNLSSEGVVFPKESLSKLYIGKPYVLMMRIPKSGQREAAIQNGIRTICERMKYEMASCLQWFDGVSDMTLDSRKLVDTMSSQSTEIIALESSDAVLWSLSEL